MLVLELIDPVKVRLLIAKTGKSLREYSKMIGISQPYLSQILSKKNNPSATVAYKIADGLGLEIQDIFLIKVIDESITV